MYLKGRSVPLRRGRSRSPRRIIVLLVLILGALLFYQQYQVGAVRVQDPFAPTATPTRSPISWAEEAKAQFAAGKFDKAVAAYKQALAQDPRNADYLVGLARTQIFAQEYEAALESAQNALLVAPDSAKTRAIYAWALRELGRTDEAQAAATQAIGLDANYAPAHAYYSFVLNDQLNWDQGFQEAQTALSLDPTLIEAHVALGYSNESVGNYEGAIKRYNDALAINPNVIEIYRKIALNYRVLQNFEQAILYFNKALSLDPTNVQPYLDLSRTNIQIDRLGVAQQYLEQALALEPENPLIHGRLGLLYFKRQNYESAEPELKLAIEGGPYAVEVSVTQTVTYTVQPLPLEDLNALEFYYTYGNLLAFYNKCSPDEAPRYLTMALNYAPDNVTVQGSYDESMELCRRFLTGAAAPEGTATPGPSPTPTRQPP